MNIYRSSMSTKQTQTALVIIYLMMTLATAFLLNGCSTISKADCIVMDWLELGRTDGMQGKPRSTFQQRAKPCIKRGVVTASAGFDHDWEKTHGLSWMENRSHVHARRHDFVRQPWIICFLM